MCISDWSSDVCSSDLNDACAVQEDGTAALNPVHGNHRRAGIRAEKNHAAIAQAGHLRHQRIIGIQNGGSVRKNDINLCAQDFGQLRGIVDVVVGKSTSWIQVGDNTHLTTLVGKAFAKYG